MKYRNIYLLIVFISSLMLGKTVYGADPSAFNVTVYKTEICQDTTCTTILDDSSGVAVDLITGTGAFGSSPSVAAGTYNTFRFTMANAGTFSGSNTGCSGTQTATDQSFVINGALTATDQVTIAFSTSDAAIPGATGWYANGSDANPYLLTAPVVVEAGMATSITMQFNTANTLSCDTSNNIAIAPPTVSVTSTVVPSSVVFTGGDYWLGGFGTRTADYLFAVRDYAPGSIIAGAYPPAGVTILTGEQIEPEMIGGVSVYETLINETATGDGAKYRAQIRSNSKREYSWGGKVRFNPPDANGEGTVDAIRESGEHRHTLTVGFNDTFIPEAISDATPTKIADYKLDAYNRVTISVDGSKPMEGAFSRDYELFYLGQVDDGLTIKMAIKVDTGNSTFPTGSYFWNQYGMGLTRQEVVDATENGNELPTSLYNYADIGWMTSDGTDVIGATLRSEVSIQDPTSISPTLTNQPGDDMLVAAISALGLTMTDGAGYMTGGDDGIWLVVSPSGESIMSISNAVSDSVEKDLGFYTHNLSSMLNSKLATVGSISAADLAGRYYLAGMWDSSSADWVDFGGSVGEVEFTADGTSGGTGIYAASSVDSNNKITNEGALFDWEIRTICLGVAADGAASTGFTRIPTSTTPCTAPAGGAAKAVDIISLSDKTTGGVFVEMFISSSGNTLSYYDPGNIDVGGGSAYRNLGTLVRLED